jgi:hypothetical protein
MILDGRPRQCQLSAETLVTLDRLPIALGATLAGALALLWWLVPGLPADGPAVSAATP